MIIQKILLPNSEICSEEAMYFKRVQGVDFNIKRRKLTFQKHSICDFATYFNSFSINKWKRNTDLQTLFFRLKMTGKYIIQFYQNDYIEKTKSLRSRILFSEYFEDSFEIPLDLTTINGVLSFRIECLSEKGSFKSGEFYTKDIPLRKPKILMAVCTFRREEFVLANLEQLTKSILSNRRSIAKDSLDVVVSDNGNTLPLEGYNEHIKVVPNRNLGGAGGFTRCMIEMLKVQNEKQYTHILMADDDIKFEPASIEKLFAFLCYLKPKFREAFVGGAMLRTDNMCMQSEVANRWEKGKSAPLHYNLPLDSFANVCKNELEHKANYLSWWFCCMPAGVVNDANLPLPIFIKRDDIEYGLRNGSKFITMNGINVWHEPFDGKRAAYLDYYYIRNQLIMESTFKRNGSKKVMLNRLKRRFSDDVFKFHYLEFKFYCKGIIDYCKGIDNFKAIDGMKLNDELRQMERKMFPLEELEIPFDMQKYLSSIPYVESKKHLLFRRLTLNGWLLPPKKEPAIVKTVSPRKLAFYRVNKALNVEISSQKGYISEKSWKELFECYNLYKLTRKMLNKYYKYAVAEFVARWRELISLDFWNYYLFGEIQPTDKVLPEIVKADPKLKQKKLDYYFDCIKKYNVDPKIIYIESRKGTDFASNMYAIVKEINHNSAYTDYQVYLAYTKESVDTIKLKIQTNGLTNINLVEKDSFEFYKLLATAKYLMTDFHLSQQYIKREGQVIVSTWHGTPLKTLGKDCKTENQTAVQRIFYIADYHVYPGRYMEEKILDVYWLRNIYQGKILETGYPRNGLIFDNKRREEIRKEMNFGNKTIILYMPTFRGRAAVEFKNDEQSNTIAKYLDEIDARLTDDQIFYVKLHNYNKSQIDYSKYKHILDVPTKYDNYEFQSACDIMVSDYSSVFFDFSVSRRKVILFQYDYETYLRERGVCLPLEEIPFPIVKDVDGLIKEINSPISYDDTAFIEKFATYDNINAAKMLCSRVILGEELPDGYKEVTVPKNGKKNVFIYTGELRTRQSSLEFWDLMNNLDFSKANYYLLYYEPIMWKYPYRVHAADDRFGQIGLWSYTSYGKHEKELRNKYVLERDISPRVKKPLMEMYKRELRKHFGGQVHCDAIVLWKCLDPAFACLFEQFAEHKVALYADGVGIYDKALVDSLHNYHYVNMSEFLDFMDNQKYLDEEIKHFTEPGYVAVIDSPEK